MWQTFDGRLKYSTDKYGVYGLAFSPDGQLLAASCRDGIRLFRVNDGQLLRTYNGNQIFSAAFSPDNQILASGSAEGEVKIWRVSDGSLLHAYNANQWVVTLAFSPDGQLLAAGTTANAGFVPSSQTSKDYNPILLWRLSDSKQLYSLTGHKNGVLSLAFNPSGQMLASGGSDGFLHLWRLSDGTSANSVRIDAEADQSKPGPEAIIQDVRFSPDGKLLAIGTDSKILLLQSDQLRSIRTFKGHSKSVLDIHFKKDAAGLLSAGEDSTIRMWQIN